MPNLETYHIILALECANSPDDCRHCGCPKDEWETSYVHPFECSSGGGHETIGWSNKAALGLSIGCFWDSLDQRTHFFDEHNLQETMQRWVDEQPLIVTFNGKNFDLPLLRGILRRRAQERVDRRLAGRDADAEERAVLLAQQKLTALCDAFKVLCAVSYDILAAILDADPLSKRIRGINGLGALASANGYGGKTGDGSLAPRDWAAGKIASVVNYNMHDVYLIKALFEKIQRGEPILRHDSSALVLPKTGGVA